MQRIENWRVGRDRLVRGEADVLIVDTSNPALRGLEILDWLAGEPPYLRYPIILATASAPPTIESRLVGAQPSAIVESGSTDRPAMLAVIDRAVVR